MQSNFIIREDFRFYIEYKIEDITQKNAYSLHLSLPKVAEAKELFEYLKNNSDLPLEFKEGRIIILPAKNDLVARGVYYGSDGYIRICCLNENIATLFVQLIKQSNINSSQITRLPNANHSFYETNILFQKHELIHPDFSLEKRIKTQNSLIDHYTFCYLALNDFQIPMDVIRIIFSLTPSFNRIIELNKQFALPHHETFKSLFEIIDCDIEYGFSNEILSLTNMYLVSLDKNKHKSLVYNMQNAKFCFLSFSDNHDSFITILSSGYKITKQIYNIITLETDGKKLIGINFNCAGDKEIFLNMVNFKTSKFYKEDDTSIYFLKDSLRKKNIFEINLLPGAYPLQEDQLDISKDKYYFCYNSKSYNRRIPAIDTIQIELIRPVSINSIAKKPKISFLGIVGTAKFIPASKINSLLIVNSNGFISGGNGEDYNPWEGIKEEVLTYSNAPFAMPKSLQDGMVESFGGLYTIINAKIDETSADLAFVAMPNIGKTSAFDIPSEVNYFSRTSYLQHMTSLVILQFYLARFSGNKMIVGRCNSFQGNKDEDIAAIYHAVNQMPEFCNVQVYFALGTKDKDVVDTYQNPSASTLKDITRIIGLIQEESKNLDITELVKNIRNNYKKGKECANKILEIFKYIDENIVANLDVLWNGISWFSDNVARNLEIKNWINHLKIDIRDGLQDGKDLSLIIFLYKENNPRNWNENIINKIDEELASITPKYTSNMLLMDYTASSKPKAFIGNK